MFSTVTLGYSIDWQMVRTLDSVIASLAGVPLPFADLAVFGISKVSDTTAAGPNNTVVRSIVLSVVPQTNIFHYSVGAPGFVNYSVVSSSPADAAGGAGVQQVRVNARSLTQDFSGALTLNGTTPVNGQPFKLDRGVIPNLIALTVEPVSFGAAQTNVGKISVYSSLDARPDGNCKMVATIPGSFQGSILSTSDADSATGPGVQQVSIHYQDIHGAAQIETVTLNGTTPVNLANANYATIQELVPTAAGAFDGNQGIITVFSGPNGTGGPIAQLAPSAFSYFPSHAGLYPTTSELGGFLTAIYTQILAAGAGSVVTAFAPVFSPI